MSFQLAKESVSDIRCDAVVNFVSPAELAETSFRSSELVELAGLGLINHFTEWEELRHNHPVVTAAYGLPHCRYIVHTVGIDPSSSVLKQIGIIQNSLEEALIVSQRSRFRSIAIPLPHFTAVNPRYSFYRVFVNIIRRFLATMDDKNEMTVILSVPDHGIEHSSSSLHDSVSQYVEENYIDLDIDEVPYFTAPHQHAQTSITDEDLLKTIMPMAARPEPTGAWDTVDEEEEEVEASAFLDVSEYKVPFEYSEALPFDFEEAEGKSDSYEDQDKSFIEMVDWWIDKKGISMKNFYLQSNLNRAMISNLRCHPGQLPKKSNAVACAIGLKLSMDEAEDLIGRAGFSFSKYVKSDVIVEYFIKKGIYDIFQINEELFAQDLSLLGTG